MIQLFFSLQQLACTRFLFRDFLFSVKNSYTGRFFFGKHFGTSCLATAQSQKKQIMEQ
jgi:hypothetical protein